MKIALPRTNFVLRIQKTFQFQRPGLHFWAISGLSTSILPILMIFGHFLPFFDDFCKICQDKALITQKWRPGRWNWKVFWILEIKLVLGSAIFIKIGVVTVEIFLIEKWCFFDFSINYCTLCGNLFKKIFCLNYPYMYIYQCQIAKINIISSSMALVSFRKVLVFSWFPSSRIMCKIKLLN